MTTIHQVMDADARQIFGKVEITYTDPFRDESLVITASETGRNTDVAQLADNIIDPAYKWFSLNDNKLDGSYHPIAADKALSVGWWGTTRSDANGVITPNPVLTISFSARALTELRVAGDSLLNVFPVDFVLRAYDATNAVVLTRTITANTKVIYDEILTTPVLGVTKLELTISKINKPSCVAKLTEMFTAIVEEYDGEIVQSIHVLEEVGYTTGSLPIGNISANEVDIILMNDNRRFDLNNAQSTLYGYVKRNRRVKVSFGADVDGVRQWYPIGTYWTTMWDMAKDSLTARLVARDRLELLRLTDFTKSTVYQNYTLKALFELILQDAGLKAAQYSVDTALANITIPYAWFDKMQHREALTRLSKCGIIQVFCTKDDVIRVNLNLDATVTSIMTFDDDTNTFNSKYPLAVAEQVNYIEVSSKQWTVGATEQIFQNADPVALNPNTTVTRTYEFASKPALSCTTPVIEATNGIVVQGFNLYAWGIDITYHHPGTTAGNVNKVTVNGQLLKENGKQVAIALDQTRINEDGKVKVIVEDDFIQSSNYAQDLANQLLATYKNSRYDVVLENRGNIALQLADRVTVTGHGDYMVTRQTLDWNGYLQAMTEGKKL